MNEEKCRGGRCDRPTQQQQHGDDEAKLGTWLSHLCPQYNNVKKYQSLSSRGYKKLTWKPPSEDTIFFLHTSCTVSLTIREQVLTGLNRVEVAWLDLDQVFNKEPLRSWHTHRHWFTTVPGQGNVATVVSDAARLELLRQYGGTYLDLDAITLRPLPTDANFLSRISDSLIANAILSFSPRHKLMQNVVEDIPNKFNSLSYTSIGADLLTHHLHQLCPQNITILNSVSPHLSEVCGDVTVFPAPIFLPFSNGTDLKDIFTEGRGTSY
ncbi:hypothetical protein Pcinc_037108 [Petrolisthes cinctipes]|uniref:Alpha 1,4-glycosyltransferase domain-containing protein n=1 Tax=Petrolisthes cinctipes TaxID=88211 RepID=A0AAE1BWC2_PETCI|nr:hypothetical protein Pcinc_037108 [Petrolisthes cinctipes]